MSIDESRNQVWRVAKVALLQQTQNQIFLMSVGDTFSIKLTKTEMH